MKTIILSVFVAIFGITSAQETPSDFDSKLSDIVSSFRSNIMDEDECDDLEDATDDLVGEIEEAIGMEEEYSKYDLLQLKNLKKEAEALNKFIRAVGNCGSSFPSIEEFNLANKRVAASVSFLSKGDYCVDFIKVKIGDYEAYLAENKTSKNYKLSYEWESSNSMSLGNGTIGVLKYSVRHIYNNRDNMGRNSILIVKANCIEF